MKLLNSVNLSYDVGVHVVLALHLPNGGCGNFKLTPTLDALYSINIVRYATIFYFLFDCFTIIALNNPLSERA